MRRFRWSGVTLCAAAIGVVACLLWIAGAARGQCPGGNCPVQYAQPRAPAVYTPGVETPRPAWRYEKAAGHRAAVVSIKTTDRDGRRSVGSGVLVRWGARVVVLTARHVVKDAVKVLVWLRHGRWYDARVLKVDATWDVAALDIGQVTEAEPAELEFGQAAHPQQGDRLESCGYGPDGKLAVNVGRFLKYRSAVGAGRVADWMVLSGQARGGDSGGPIFNAAGHVVGVLWGTDGQEVIGAQAGRLHLVLESACGPRDTVERSEKVVATPPKPTEAPVVPVALDVLEASLGVQPRCLPLFRARPEQQPTPAPQVIVQADIESRSTLQRIDVKLDQIVRNTAPPPQPQPEADDRHKFHPLLAGLVIAAAVAVGFVIYFGTQKG